jgi:hypothetical protein
LLLFHALAAVCSCVGYWMIHLPLAWLRVNLFLMWGGSIGAALIAYITAFVLLAKKIDVTKMPAIRCKRAYKVGGILLFWGVSLFLAISLLHLMAAEPETAQALRERSLIARHLLVTPPIDDSDPSADPDEPSSWERIKQQATKTSGANSLVDSYNAMCFLLELDEDECTYLVENNKPLHDLLNHPILLKILEDDELVDTILGSELSLKEVYGLGSEQEVKQLLNDPVFRESVEKINLVEMCQQVREYRKQKRQVSDVSWEKSWVDSTLDLDACLADAARWTACKSTEDIGWPKGRYGLLRTALPQGDWLVTCKAKDRPTLLINDESVKMRRQDDVYIYPIKETSGNLSILLMHEQLRARSNCSVKIFKD